MKNIIVLVLFFFGLGVLYANYFIPTIDQKNKIDQINSILHNVKKQIPLDSKIYFLSETNIKDNPEIYYKVQFSLAPRIVIAEKYSNIPTGSYVVYLKDNAVNQKDFTGYQVNELLQSKDNGFFRLIFLKKKA